MRSMRIMAVLALGLVGAASGQIASNPSPADGALHPQTSARLSWSPGVGAVSHDVYFGEDYDQVNEATQASGTFLGNTTNTWFLLGSTGRPYPNGLVPCTTYYWRIDEVEADTFTKHRGPVWSFSVTGVPPIADAGPDQTITDADGDGSEPVLLDGSGSTDPDGWIVSYTWWTSPTGDPADLQMIAQGPTAMVTLPVGTYTVTLIVTDNGCATDSDTVVITISAGGGDRLRGNITTTDPTGIVHVLRHVMVSLDWGGTQHPTYTDDNGDYVIDMSSDSTFFVGSTVNGRLRVTLEDEGDGTNPYIKVYNNNTANPIFAETARFSLGTNNDLQQNIDLSNNPNIDAATLPISIANLDDAAIIYFHTYQALDFALNTLGLTLDYALPVEVLAWGGGTWYWTGWTEIEIGAGDSDFTSGNRPDNREWHEFSHHIMADSIIAGDNALPQRHTGMPPWTAGDTNHGGYGNHCTSDSWTEGFAEYNSCLIADDTGDPIPRCYAIAGNACAFDLEANWEAWDLWGAQRPEEFAVAGLLWDLQDGTNAADSDWIDLSVAELWNQLNDVNHENVRDIYLTLNALNWAALTGDDDNDGIDNLDELFISHGHFSDANGNQTYDAGEVVGFTGDAARPNRQATPEIPGSYVRVDVIDSDTLEQVDVSEFDVQMRVDPPHDYLNVDFTIRKKDDGSLYFTMPPRSYSAKAYIYAKKNGYHDSTPLVMDSSFYWEKIQEPGLQYLTEHTSYLTPAEVEIRLVTLTSPSPSDKMGTLPTSISSVSEGQDYYIEIWASDVSSTNAGLASVYVDMHFDPCSVAMVQEIDHGGIFTLSKSGTIEPWGIDELGGSCQAGAGKGRQWARVAVVKVRAEVSETVCCSLTPSEAGVAAIGGGLIPWSEVILSGDMCCFSSAHPAFSDWFAAGKPACWCYLRQCHGDADGNKAGSSKAGYYYVGPSDLNVLVASWMVKEAPYGPGIASIEHGICADFARDQEGSAKTGFYRVGPSDLNVLVANWLRKEPPQGTGIEPDCLDSP
ncbi:MAG: fibronectin type III domain-containing protein [Phycisphaerales bacterium]|nr:MAG: fibronectin type III domain-containing protein [Phycisphaerales bacterium]